MRDRWKGDKNADPIALAVAYFKHPSDCDWHKDGFGRDEVKEGLL
jgi:hypothetical protein